MPDTTTNMVDRIRRDTRRVGCRPHLDEGEVGRDGVEGDERGPFHRVKCHLAEHVDGLRSFGGLMVVSRGDLVAGDEPA